ncbi:MAG: triple tyrosine motif-containing protein, partial [Chitinophagaceae bacterium]
IYNSLDTLNPGGDKDYADVWDVFIRDKHVFFRSNRKIFDLYNNKITIHPSVNWGFLGATVNELIAFDYTNGLVAFRNNKWQQRISNGKLPLNVVVKSVLDIGNDSLLLATLLNGLFILHHDSLSAFVTPDITAIAEKNIFGASILSPDRIALITSLGGCIIINKQGQFIQRLTKQEGIQNNNILSLMLDKDKNLWLGTDNGIDLVTYSNAIKNIFPDRDDRNSGYSSIIYDNHLYLALSTGVYETNILPSSKDLSYTQGEFEMVNNTKGQVWNLAEAYGKLIVAHSKGAYLVNGNNATALDERTGFWDFQPLFENTSSPMMIAGTYNGLNFYRYANNEISKTNIQAQFESARFIVIDKNVIWVAHPYKGIYKISFDANNIPVTTMYKDKNGILSSNHNKIFRIAGEMILISDKGIFEYDEDKGDFVRSTYLEKILGKAPVSYIKEDIYGNIWFCRDRKVAVADLSDRNNPHLILFPELDDKIMASGFEDINVIDSNNVFIAAEKGFFHINYAQYKKNKYPLKVLIRNVTSTTRQDGLIFGGYTAPGEKLTEPSIAYKYNSLHFEFSSTLYGQEQNTEYSYYLSGFDNGWSDWSRKTEKDYTNLPAGSYELRIKCRNNVDNESSVVTYSFVILPPWYQTWWAWSLYLILFSGLIYLFYKRQQRKYKRQEQIKLLGQQRKYDEEQKQLQMIHELEIEKSEKEIIELKNEKLQGEIGHKNTELASSAMNLVRKKEILSKLKDNLNVYKSNPDVQKAGKEFQKIIRLIDSELDHDEEWEQFAKHFDSVHTDYLKRLKEYYPDLTASELKLAAYLRLNLSTKEIAHLMNISIRGVETSRYRLRKKLGLSSNETNLFDFLINITSK